MGEKKEKEDFGEEPEVPNDPTDDWSDNVTKLPQKGD
jgi:hypothetical protein|tara:strand:+ start:558 stop:668 length:111 start_codon:yes stop_codon:yes gene_type:complete